MSKLIYITNTSLDGYVVDEAGAFDWVNPIKFTRSIAELVQPIGAHLYGRRLYETMAHWDGPMGGLSARTPRLRTDLAEGPEDRLCTNLHER